VIPLVIAIGFLLLASAFFSSAETAFFSLSPLRSARLSNNRLVNSLLRSRDRLLATILSGNLIVNFAATSLWTALLIQAAKHWNWNETQTLTLGVVLMVLMLLLFGEITPKIIAVRFPVRLSKLYAPIIVFFSWIFFPITWALGALAKLLRRRRPKEAPFPTDEEVKTMIEMAVRYGILRKDEERIMENLVDLGERTVTEIMTPRVEMKAISLDTKYQDVMAYIRKTRKSRYPVYKESADQIVGIVYTKDLLTSPAPIELKELLRDPYYVPETKALSDLLEELRRSDRHIAVVIDEFGGTAGIVTLEDILEAIFGEIADEFDSATPYKKQKNGSYIVDGYIDLATLNQLFDEAFAEAEDEFDRLSELITHELGRIPKNSDTITYNGIIIKIQKVRNLKIDKVVLKKEKPLEERSK